MTFIFHFSSNFLKMDVYFAALKLESIQQNKAYGVMNYLSMLTITIYSVE